MPKYVFAGREWLDTSEHAYQRGFTCAVRAHERHAITALHHEVYVVKDFVPVIALGYSLKLGNNATARFRLREVEVDGLLFRWNLDALHAFDFLDAALHLFCLSRLISETTDESFQLLNLLALVAVGRFELVLTLLALRHVLLEIAAVELNAFVPDLYRLLDGHVKE